MLILQSMLDKCQMGVIAPNVSDVLLEAYFQAAACVAYIW